MTMSVQEAEIFEDLDGLTADLMESLRESSPFLHEDENSYEMHYRLSYGLMETIRRRLEGKNGATPLDKLDYDTHNRAAEGGLEIEDMTGYLNQMRMELLKRLQGKAEHTSMSCYQLINSVVEVFDEVINTTTSNYNSRYQEQLEQMRKEMLELSAPIVPVRDRISVLPLIGNLTQRRTSSLLENTLPRLTESKTQTIIVDFSGAYEITQEVADHLFMILDSMKLVGLKVIVSGIRSETAQMIIEQNINLADYPTYQSVKSVLNDIAGHEN
ncbi:STAS domain-containing protein [Bacillus daqingensis]|uniref:STAS domain-containing protein n=2 Tax=Bacillus daqingensis TaxID=872396 RepID=A0ABV9NTR3_9BACI